MDIYHGRWEQEKVLQDIIILLPSSFPLLFSFLSIFPLKVLPSLPSSLRYHEKGHVRIKSHFCALPTYLSHPNRVIHLSMRSPMRTKHPTSIIGYGLRSIIIHGHDDNIAVSYMEERRRFHPL